MEKNITSIVVGSFLPTISIALRMHFACIKAMVLINLHFSHIDAQNGAQSTALTSVSAVFTAFYSKLYLTIVIKPELAQFISLYHTYTLLY